MAVPGPLCIEIVDVEYKHEAPSSDHDDQMDLAHDDRDGGPGEDADENAVSVPTGDEDSGADRLINGIASMPRGFADLNESAAMAIFADYRQLCTYMSDLSSRLTTMLTHIKSCADPTTCVVTLQEPSELLSTSTEDTLAGSFQVDAFVHGLVNILGCTGSAADGDDGDNDDNSH